ncbi:DegT/DnrJ/EryC1/StrS family aminotransferase [Methanophagales archaeon]|nr:MAG: DegT/DnrJ/EryC1/StrS family aminotransferase [Methanophagales archaeon]
MEPWIGEEEKRAMMEYLNSGGWLTEFRKTREFERMIASYVGSKYASVVSNGTVSLVIALMALSIGKGDEVIVPDYTMIASANAVVLAGAKPVLVDIDRSNLCLDLDLVEEAITPKTKAIMLVTINGRYPEMKKFVKFAHDHDLFLVEDAAQSLGSRFKGKHLGTFGDVGSFSFSAPKVITTGQGGALVTDNEEIYQKILKIKDFGRAKSGVDYHETMGYNFKFTDLQAVIGIEQMKKLDWRVKRKKEMYKLYKELLEDIEGIEFIDTNLADTSPWFIDILVEKGEKERDKLASFLDKKGIGTRPFYPAIHTQPPYSWVNGDFKNAEYVSERGLWLPSASFLSDDDIEYICQNIKDFFL